MTQPTCRTLSPPASTSAPSPPHSASWWSTVASVASASWSRLPSLAPPKPRPSSPTSALSHRDPGHFSPSLPRFSCNDKYIHCHSDDNDDDDDDDSLSWQVVLTNHGQVSSIDGSSGPLVMPESQFIQLPQLQPIHGLLPFDDESDNDSASDTDSNGDAYVTPALRPDTLPVAAAVVASPRMLPSVPESGQEEPMLVATVDAYSLLDNGQRDDTDSDEDEDEDEVEMSIDQLDALLSRPLSHANAPAVSSPSPSPSPLPPTPPPSTTLSPSDSGVLVPIPTWAWHFILHDPNANAARNDSPKTPIAKKRKARIAKSANKDLRRVARDALSARGCMGRFQRRHGPQAAHSKHARDSVGKRGAGKCAI